EINGSTSVSLNINNITSGQQTIQIPSGTSETINFTATETATGTYNVQVGTLTGSFTVVPTGMYTLSIGTFFTIYDDETNLWIYTEYDMQFTLDNQTETTPYSSLVTAGDYAVAMPAAYVL